MSFDDVTLCWSDFRRVTTDVPGASRSGHLWSIFMPITMGIAMRTYYFDLIDGVPTRDRQGLDFPTASSAIEHCRDLVKRLRADPKGRKAPLSIVVLDESGTEIHRERVFPEAPVSSSMA